MKCEIKETDEMMKELDSCVNDLESGMREFIFNHNLLAKTFRVKQNATTPGGGIQCIVQLKVQ